MINTFNLSHFIHGVDDKGNKIIYTVISHSTLTLSTSIR